jgi:CBS domain containing-hemolysin-like protein
MAGFLLLLLISLLLTAFFAGAEIAFITANKLGVEIERDKGTPRSRIIAGFYARPKAFLSALLVGSNIVLVLFTYAMIRLLEPVLMPRVPSAGLRLLLITILAAAIILVLGKFIPKAVFRVLANHALSAFAYPMRFFQALLRVPAWVMMSLTNAIIRVVFRAPVQAVDDTYTRRDLQDYVEGTLSRDKDELEAGMFKNALQLKTIKARECMVPRTEIVHVDVADGMEALKQVFMETRHSRILISQDDLDSILGYVHHQSLLGASGDIRKLILPIPYFPEVTSVMEILTAFMRQKRNIAVIVDEFGGTAGIITLEDITEEIVGEIEDEHDLEDRVEQVISDTEYLFSGRLEIDYLNAKYPALSFPIGEYETLSGYIVMTSGTIPDQGDSFELDDYRFVIEKVSDRKIDEVRVFLVDGTD